MYLFWELKNIPQGFENFEKFQSFPLSESLLIYRFLYHLPNELLNNLTAIRFFGSLNSPQKKKFSEALKNFEADLSNYIDDEVFNDLIKRIPTEEYFYDEKRKSRIEKLIEEHEIESKFKITDYLNSKTDEDYILLYNNLSKETIDLLNVNKGKVILWINKTFENDDELRLIDNTTLKKVNNGIRNLKENFRKNKFSLNEFKTYRPPNFFENFKNGFYNNINQLMINENRRVFLFGSEIFIAKKSSNKLADENSIIHYDLRNGFPNLNAVNGSLLILNIEVSQNHNLHQLASQLRMRNKKDHIIIEGSDLSADRYFNDYVRVDLPTAEEINERITGLLIALLRERCKYDRAVHDAFLYRLIENNLLRDFFTDTIDLDALSMTISYFNRVSYEDLIENEFFWITFITHYESLKSNLPYVMMKDKLKIEIADTFMRIDFNNQEYRFSIKSKSVLYLAVIIELFKKTNEKVHVIDIREAVQKHLGEDENQKVSLLDKEKNASDAVRKSLKGLASETDLKIIFEKYIKFENYSYYLTHTNEIDITITGFSL